MNTFHPHMEANMVSVYPLWKKQDKTLLPLLDTHRHINYVSVVLHFILKIRALFGFIMSASFHGLIPAFGVQSYFRPSLSMDL